MIGGDSKRYVPLRHSEWSQLVGVEFRRIADHCQAAFHENPVTDCKWLLANKLIGSFLGRSCTLGSSGAGLVPRNAKFLQGAQALFFTVPFPPPERSPVVCVFFSCSMNYTQSINGTDVFFLFFIFMFCFYFVFRGLQEHRVLFQTQFRH